ncbi:MAG: class I SAM-dependent methyltransferase [Novosphingobium sp.]
MSTNPIARRAFSEVYKQAILGRSFVEDVDYYRQSEERFWKAFQEIESLGLAAGSRVLDIGGGIMAVLLSKLLHHDAIVGDVTPRAREDVQSSGLNFVAVDLFRDGQPPLEPVDLVVLQEVIEHIPQPPYVVINRIKRFLKPQGFLFMTTPNGHRVRNLLYMVAGKEVLGLYKYPEPGEALGHQHEYTLKQMTWQAANADMDLIFAKYYEDGFRGASLSARVARILTKPATMVPHWRNGLMLAVRQRCCE